MPRVVVNYQVHESDTQDPSGSRVASPSTRPRSRPCRAQGGARTRTRRRSADATDDHGWCSPGRTAPRSTRDLITDWFRAAAPAAAGLPPIRLHDVRHSYATAALAAGIPAKVVSERLGHANVAITLDTYSHVIPGMDAQAAATVAGLILTSTQKGPDRSPGPLR